MSVKLTISIPDIDAQIAAGYDYVRVFRSVAGSAGPFVEVTASTSAAATLTGTLVGPFVVAGLTFSVRINRGPVQQSQITGTNPLSASQVAAALQADLIGLVGQDDGTGRLQLATDGTGTDEVLELLGDSGTLDALGFEVGQSDTGEASRIPMVQGVTAYLFEDVAGTADDYYQIDFYDSSTSATSDTSDPVKGTAVETKPKQQADSRSPRGLTLTRKTTHVFRNGFFADDSLAVPLVPVDASRYPSFQIVDINGQIVSSGLATLDGQAGHYRVEFMVPCDAPISNDDRRWRLEWLMVDQNNRQIEKTTEFDVRDVEVTATPVRDIKLLAMCDQPLRLFIRELHRPYSIILTVSDTSGTIPIAENVVYPGAVGDTTLTEVVENETYVYYYDVPAGTLSAGATYQAVFQIRPTSSSVAQHAFQVIEVPPTMALQYFPALRMCIDKYQKRRELLQAYQDSDIYEYLTRGLQVVNGFHPVTSFQMTTLPEPLVPFWLMAGQLWGLNAQFLLETDLQFSFCLEEDSLVRTDRGLVKVKDLAGRGPRALAAARIIKPQDRVLVAQIQELVPRHYHAQELVDRLSLQMTAQQVGMTLARLGLSQYRHSDHAGRWVWDTGAFEPRLADLGIARDRPVRLTSRYGVALGTDVKQPLHIWDLGVQAVQRVTTALGYEIDCTAEHGFLTLNADTLEATWKPLSQLAVGDLVALDTKAEAPGDWDVRFDDVSDVDTPTTADMYRLPERLTPELARVLGYLVAEGSVNSDNATVFGIGDAAMQQQFRADFEACFHAPPEDDGLGKVVDESFITDGRTESDVHYYRGKGVQLRRFLASIGLGYEKSRDKQIPWCILEAPKSLVAPFLQAYFDGDGCFTDRQIFFCSFSDTLRRQLQALLLRFGIVSRNAARAVTVRGPSLRRYASDIGFLHKSGAVHEGKLYPQRESLPHPLFETLRNIRALVPAVNQKGWYRNADGMSERAKLYWNHSDHYARHTTWHHVEQWWHDGRSETLLKLAPHLHERIEFLLEKRFQWVPIESVVPLGQRHVLDPCLPEGDDLLAHGFTADGFVTHNSGQTVTLDYDHTGNIDTAISRALDFLREGIGPAKLAAYRRQAGVGAVAGRPYRIGGLHNYVYPISRMGSSQFLQLLTNYGLL